MTRIKSILFQSNTVCFFIAVVSFFFYSPLYSNYFNSDNAIHVLMSRDFSFSSDLYYWGQARLGSFVPMLTWLLHFLIPISLVVLISIVQFLLLYLGFIFMTSHIKDPLIKIPLCIIWFFPLFFFVTHLWIGHPYAAQYFFLGLSLLFTRKWHEVDETQFKRKSLLIFLTFLFFGLSIWITDMNFFILPLFALYFMLYGIRVSKDENQGIHLALTYAGQRLWLYLILSGLALYLVLKMIAFAKTDVYLSAEYDVMFSTGTEMARIFSVAMDNMAKAVTFRVRDIPLSFHTLFIFLLLLLLLAYRLWPKIKRPPVSPLSVFFLSAALFAFFFSLFSNWVRVNGYDLRYFSYGYFLLLLFIATAVHQVEVKRIRRVMVVIFWLAAFGSGITSLNLAIREPEITKDMSVSKIFDVTKKIGDDAGIIGDYWTSYNLAVGNPYEISATPYESGGVRSEKMLRETISKKWIFLAGNNWLSEFPEETIQFGCYLKKADQPFSVNEVQLCKYKRLKPPFTFPLNLMGHNNGQFINKEGTQVLIKIDSVNHMDGFLFYGPFLRIDPGKYKIKFSAGSLSKFDPSHEVRFDLVSHWGDVVLSDGFISVNNLSRDEKSFEFNFNLKEETQWIELRTYLRGNEQVYITDVEILPVR